MTPFSRLLLLATVSTLGFSADGTLDTTFGTAGIVADSSAFVLPQAVTIQPNGAIVVVGAVPPNMLIERRTSVGALDATFGSSGRLVVANTVIAYGVLVQADGKIVAVGYNDNTATSHKDAVVVRCTSAGVVDATFGVSGYVTIGSSTQDTYAYAVAEQADHKLIVVGRRNTAGFALRFNSDGSTDWNYGNFAGMSESADLQLQADGMAVVATASSSAMVVRRFTTSGTLDSGFGTSGVATVTLPSGTSPLPSHTHLRIDGTGRIYVGSNLDPGAPTKIVVSRLSAAGVFDTTYGASGFAPSPLINVSLLGFALQSDGAVILTGDNWSSTANTTAVRLTAAGLADSTFGSSGIVDLGANGNPVATTLQADGRLVVVSDGGGGGTEKIMRLTGSVGPAVPGSGGGTTTAGSTTAGTTTAGTTTGSTTAGTTTAGTTTAGTTTAGTTTTGGASSGGSSGGGGCGLGSGLAAVLIALGAARRTVVRHRRSVG